MSLIDRLNRLDERAGADRVGQGFRIYGIYFAWPIMVVFGIALGTASLFRGWVGQGLLLYGFAAAAGLLIFVARRASKSYRAHKQLAPSARTADEPSRFDVR